MITRPGELVAVQAIRVGVSLHLLAVGCGLVGAGFIARPCVGMLMPLVSGLACGWVAGRGGRRLGAGWRVALGVGYGVCAAIVAFVAAGSAFGPTGMWLPPMLCSAAGAVAWPLLDTASLTQPGAR